MLSNKFVPYLKQENEKLQKQERLLEPRRKAKKLNVLHLYGKTD